MNRLTRGSILRTLGMALPFLAIAVSSMAEGPTISGYIDTQYGYNFNQPNTGMTALRSYDAQDNNIANTAHLSLAGSFGEGIGYVVDIDAGHDAATTLVDPTVNASAVVLQEAYLTYVSSIKLGMKVGKFATYQGIEVIETNANPTISRGLLYGLAEPVTHVGGVVTLALGSLDFAAGVVNGWDVPNDNNQAKTLVGKIGLSLGDALTATLSGLHGAEQSQTLVGAPGSAIVNANSGDIRDSLDLTLLTKIIPFMDLYLQGNVGTEESVADNDGDTIADDRGSWSGFGIQPVIRLGDKLSIGARAEYFADPQGVRTLTGNQDVFVNNFTITPGYKLTDNILVRAEYRLDSSNKKIWVDDKGSAKDTASTAAVQFVLNY